MGLAATFVATAALAQTDPEDFRIETGQDLVELCSVQAGDELYVPAIHMCHGYVSGVAQYALALFVQGSGSFFCLPDPVPSRNDAIAAFLAFAQSNPDVRTDVGPTALAKFLEAEYPCQ